MYLKELHIIKKMFFILNLHPPQPLPECCVEVLYFPFLLNRSLKLKGSTIAVRNYWNNLQKVMNNQFK